MVSDLYVSIYMKDRCVCAHLSADKRKIVCVYALKAYKFMCLCMFFYTFHADKVFDYATICLHVFVYA